MPVLRAGHPARYTAVQIPPVRSERAGFGVHEIVDHVENMDGFKLLPGAAPRQMRSRGAVVGKRRDHRDCFPFPIQPLLAQNAIRIRHSCRAVRLVERISIAM